jgi:prepilin-type N-terminal cleavage/methylation domain-containing protein
MKTPTVAAMFICDRYYRHSQRNGFSLVEMLVVIALSSLVFGIVISLMLSLQKFDRQSAVNSTYSEQLLRLADTLRSDIRAASDVNVSDEGALVIVTSSGEGFRYELGADDCRRTAIAPGATESQADVFAIGEPAEWRFEKLASGRVPLVSVKLERRSRKSNPEAPLLLPFLVQAAVGADRVDGGRVDGESRAN